MRYLLALGLASFFFLSVAHIGTAKAQGSNPNYPDLSKQQVTALALDIFFNYCLKTYGYGQAKMAQDVEKNFPDFVRDELLPADKQSTFYQKENNHLWLMQTPVPNRKIRMGFKKSNECFVHANDIDQAALVAGFRARIPDKTGSIFEGVIVRSDFAFNGLEDGKDVRRGSYEVYKKNPYDLLYTVSLTTSKNLDKGYHYGLFYMEPYLTPAQKY